MQQYPCDYDVLAVKLGPEEREQVGFIMKETGITAGSQVLRMALLTLAKKLGWSPKDDQEGAGPLAPTGTEGR